MNIQTKEDLLAAISEKRPGRPINCIAGDEILTYLHEWIRINYHQSLAQGNILPLLPRIVHMAWEELRTTKTSSLAQLYGPKICKRAVITDTTPNQLPDLTDPRHNQERTNLVVSISQGFGLITESDSIKQEIYNYFYAKDCVLDQAVTTFCQKVFKNGLRDFGLCLNEQNQMRGYFFRPRLLIFRDSDQIFIDIYEQTDSAKARMSCPIIDTSCLEFHLNYTSETFDKSLWMIDQICKTWPDNPEAGLELAKIYFR